MKFLVTLLCDLFGILENIICLYVRILTLCRSCYFDLGKYLMKIILNFMSDNSYNHITIKLWLDSGGLPFPLCGVSLPKSFFSLTLCWCLCITKQATLPGFTNWPHTAEKTLPVSLVS